MCARCKSEAKCTCECKENLAIIQEEFFPFDVIKINCDACAHVLATDQKE